jgi:hypothetical protein
MRRENDPLKGWPFTYVSPLPPLRDDRAILASTLTPCPLLKRQRDRMRWRGIIAALALEAVVAAVVVGIIYAMFAGGF